MVNKVIREQKKKYASPLYNDKELHEKDENLLEMTIPDKLFLEMILLEIRTATLTYSKNKKLATMT